MQKSCKIKQLICFLKFQVVTSASKKISQQIMKQTPQLLLHLLHNM